MTPTVGNYSVINGMTDGEWLSKVRDTMTARKDILLFLSKFEDCDDEELKSLCLENGYAPPAPPPEGHWQQLQKELNLSGYAAKEQGINRNFAYFLSAVRTA